MSQTPNPANSSPCQPCTAGNIITHLLERAQPHLSDEELRWITTAPEEAFLRISKAAEMAEHLACNIACDETNEALGDRFTVSATLFTLAHVMQTAFAMDQAATIANNHLMLREHSQLRPKSNGNGIF